MSEKYFLDTNIVSYFLKGLFPKVKEHFFNVECEKIFIPSIVVAEIEYGARHSRDYEKTMFVYRPFLETFSIADFDMRAAFEYGKIREELFRTGNPIGPNDMQIAAIAIANGGILVTHNKNEFSKIKNLEVQDWTI